jgi:putative peptide zinc metalloprotease protein
VKRKPLLISLAISAAFIAGVCYIPLPHHVDCAFEVRPSQAGSVYAGTPGRIQWTVDPKTVVEVGDPIAVLKNPDLEIRLAELSGEESVSKVKLRNLAYQVRYNEALKSQIETQVELLESVQHMREKTEEELDRLTVRAKRSGYVIEPPRRESQSSNDGRLPGWTGSPLDEKNRGALLTADDVICEIGTPDAYEAVVVVDQGDVQLVREGQTVDLKFDSRRIETFSGMITEKSNEPLEATSVSMSSQTGGDLQTEIDPTTGMVKPRSVSYQARVPLNLDDMLIRPGYRGSAKIHVDPMSLGERLWRVIARTFNFEL